MTAVTDNALAKPEVYETRRIQLTSPLLHIGSAVSRLNPFEYVQTDQRVYLPNQDVLARVLKQQGYLEDYIARIDWREDITSLLEAALGEDWRQAKSDRGEAIFPRLMSSLKWVEGRVTDLRPMIRNGMGYLYIPGTSIKGAMRTAIAYHMLKHSDRYRVPKEQQVSEIERRLRQSLGNLKQKAKFADDDLFMDRLFNNFDLVYQGQAVTVQEGSNTDFMRAVQVTDSTALIEEKFTTPKGKTAFINLPVVPEVIVSSHFPDGRAKYRASIYAEMVRSVKTEFSISLDTEMLSWFQGDRGLTIPFQSVTDLLNICQEFAQDQWDYEHDYWQNVKNNPNAQGKNLDFSAIREFYEAEQCPFSLRLGWASGMMGTTIGLLLDDALRAEIRDACGIRAPGFEAPKSRRTIMTKSGEIKFVPGWVKFKVV
ncbi:MAG: type III-A CRISPR-associated RAMP protein Csm5 [Cyanobacteria bacterium CRU_2_1]|nr:type III-A CRISPR-associated RAMP protein Csm5 [Cyanobacteria bacterium CRU_2_1]